MCSLITESIESDSTLLITDAVRIVPANEDKVGLSPWGALQSDWCAWDQMVPGYCVRLELSNNTLQTHVCKTAKPVVKNGLLR